MNTITADDVAEVLLHKYFPLVGFPRSILSDRGTNFISEMLTSMFKGLGVRALHTTAYHPQANGLVERFNGTLVRSLSKYVWTCPAQWDVYLPHMVTAYNTAEHKLLKRSPHEVLMGYKWRNAAALSLPSADDLEISATREPLHKQAADRVDHLVMLQATITEILNEEQERYVERAQQKEYVPPFRVGEEVWLYRPNIALPQEAEGRRKFQPNWDGPYQVREMKENRVNYVIMPLFGVDFDLSSEMKSSDNSCSFTVHVSRLKRYVRPTMQREAKPPDDFPEDLSLDLDDPEVMAQAGRKDVRMLPHAAEIVHGTAYYEIEKVLDKRYVKNPKGRSSLEYKVRYRGYGPEHDDWRPVKELKCKKLIKQFINDLAAQARVSSLPVNVSADMET